MSTQLQIVNKVYRRLRDDTVASVSENDYSKLLAIWVNDGMRDITDAFMWTSLKHEITLTLAAGTSEYDISELVSGGGDVPNTERATNMESLLVWDKNLPSAFLFDDASDTTHNAQMRLITEEERVRRYQTDRSLTNLEPTDFSLKLAADGDGYLLTVWPAPTAARTVRINFWTPQAEFALDGTDDSTEIIMHAPTIEAYVHLVAANERGEEMGEPGNMLERRYNRLFGAILEAALKNDERLNMYESYRD